MSTQRTPDNVIQTINPQGYVNNREITNLPGVYLVKGSKNCIIVNKEKVSSRMGYSVVGGNKTKNVGHYGSYDWETHRNVTRSVRVNDDGDYEVYYAGSWHTLKSFSEHARPNFAEFWDDTEQTDMLLCVDGVTDGIHMWSGAIAVVDSGTDTTLTLASGTWAQSGFLLSGTRAVVIDGVEYEYTGGEDTDTLTGLTGLPGVSSGDVVLQAVRVSAPAALDGMVLGLIASFNNYVFFGDLTKRTIMVSSNSDYTDFSYTSPLRVPGEGFLITLDSTPTAFIPAVEEDAFYVAGRKNDMFKIVFVLSSDQGAEQIRVKKLPTSTGQAARSQGSVVRIKNGVAFITFEPTIDTLSRIGSVTTPSSRPISHDIQNDILTYDLSDAHGMFYQNQMFFALPNESTILIYDIEQQLWQPPQTGIPVGRLALIDVDGTGTQVLCGHSSVSNETYRLFYGYNDNTGPIAVSVVFGYENFGTRFHEKLTDEYSTEIYMSEHTSVTEKVILEYNGGGGVREFIDNGTDYENRFTPSVPAGLGAVPLGQSPLGSLASPIEDLAKYRFINTTGVTGFFERQRAFFSEGIDIRFSIVAYGENAELSDSDPTYLKR